MTGKDLREYLKQVYPYEYRVGFLPEGPANCALIQEEPGDPDRDVAAIEVRAFQIVVRAEDYPSCESAARGIYDAIRNVNHVQIGDQHAHSIRAVQTPFPLGYEGDRCLMTFNIRITLGPLEGGEPFGVRPQQGESGAAG